MRIETLHTNKVSLNTTYVKVEGGQTYTWDPEATTNALMVTLDPGEQGSVVLPPGFGGKVAGDLLYVGMRLLGSVSDGVDAATSLLFSIGGVSYTLTPFMQHLVLKCVSTTSSQGTWVVVAQDTQQLEVLKRTYSASTSGGNGWGAGRLIDLSPRIGSLGFVSAAKAVRVPAAGYYRVAVTAPYAWAQCSQTPDDTKEMLVPEKMASLSLEVHAFASDPSAGDLVDSSSYIGGVLSGVPLLRSVSADGSPVNTWRYHGGFSGEAIFRVPGSTPYVGFTLHAYSGVVPTFNRCGFRQTVSVTDTNTGPLGTVCDASINIQGVFAVWGNYA